jgi:cytochrome d ubiquinol oxidase subunit I
MAFFLEATFVGLFFFGWKRLSKIGHLVVTWLVALGSSLSALWILIANGWMQHPTGAYFNFHTMRMEVKNFAEVILNPVAQAKFVHTISAGYVTGAIFVLAISAFYLLRGRNIEIAKRSMVVAVSFGLASALAVAVLGDESGYMANENQKMKLASVEGEWETEKAPAAFNLIGFPNQKEHKTEYAIKIPYVLGLIATRSIDTPVPGIKELVAKAKIRVKNGIPAYGALQELQKNPNNKQAQALLTAHEKDLGYALLLKKYTDDVIHATPGMITMAAWDTVPTSVAALFWTFRVMVACAIYFILLFLIGFILSAKRKLTQHRWYWRLALYTFPLAWIASWCGWFVAEFGRQPWVVEGVLPTFLGTSSLSAGHLWFSLAGFVIFYTVLAVIEVFLMVKYIRLGPDGIELKAGGQ